MAVEIKSMEIENEEEEAALRIMGSFGWTLKSSQRIFSRTTTPKGAISWEGLTYIHSETDTVDFTKLVFERDTHMPYYEDIVALEEEFWQLLDEKADTRPPEPPLIAFEDWVERNQPSVVTLKEKILTALVSWPLCQLLIALLFIMSIGGVSEANQWLELFKDTETAIYCILIAPLPFAIPLALLLMAVLTKIKAVMAPRCPHSKGYQRLQAQYTQYLNYRQSQIDEINFYDYAQRRISEILAEARSLV